jgi:hypothetical protein
MVVSVCGPALSINNVPLGFVLCVLSPSCSFSACNKSRTEEYGFIKFDILVHFTEICLHSSAFYETLTKYQKNFRSNFEL